MKTKMKTEVITALRIAILGSAVAFASSGNAANFECDGVMKGLLNQNGGCQTGNCKYNIINGQIVGFNGGVVTKDDGYTEMKSISTPAKGWDGVTSARIEVGKDGAYKLNLSSVDEKGKTTKTEYTFTAGKGTCTHEMTERKNDEDLAMNVDFDRPFCEAAAQAYDGLSAEQAATCDGVLNKLVGKYDDRLKALAEERKMFRTATPDQKINAKVMKKQKPEDTITQARMLQALKQKDKCSSAAAEVNSARPLTFSQRYRDLLEPRGEYSYTDKRAYPLKDFRLKDSATTK